MARPGSAPAAYQPASAQAVGRPAVEADDPTGARALLDRVIAAKGGVARLRSVKSLVITMQARAVGASAQQETAETTTYIEYPAHVRVESRMRGSEMVQVYDGTRAWVRDPKGVHDVPERMLADFRNGLRRDTIGVLLAALDGAVRVRRLPDVTDASGGRQQALEFSAADLDPTVLYVDPGTSLVVRQTYVAGGMGRPLVEERFTDYRDVDGVQINFAAAIHVGGEPVLERTVMTARVGGALEPALFKRPSP